MKLKSILFAFCILLAIIFNSSCSSGDNENDENSSSSNALSSSNVSFSSSALSSSSVSYSSSNDISDNIAWLRGDTVITTEVYAIENMASNFFTGFKSGYECDYGTGILVQEKDYLSYPGTIDNKAVEINYEINGNTLNLWDIQFKGESNSIIGTWTKETLLECDSYKCTESTERGFRNAIEKLVFTQDSVAITHNSCYKDRLIKDGEIFEGVWWRVVDCRTFEMSKGTEIVIMEYGKDNEVSLIYNSKTCVSSEPSYSVKEAACKTAYEKELAEGGDAYDYYEELTGFFRECVEDINFPEWAKELFF